MSRLDYLERNILINGGFEFFQRNFTSAVNLTGTLSYLNADRFVQSFTGTVTGTPTTIRSADVPANGKSTSSLALICQRNASPVTISVGQRVESVNTLEISNEVVSASLMYKFPIATQIQMVLLLPNALDNHASQTQFYSQTVVVTADNTWRQAKFEGISLPSLPNGLAVRFNIILPNGTDASAVTHLLSQIKVNKGYKATAFSRAGADFAEELSLARRYYEKSYELNTNPATATAANEIVHWCPTVVSTPNYYRFLAEKRVAPTMSFWSRTSVAGQWVDNALASRSVDSSAPYTHGVVVFVTPGAVNRYVQGHYVADAEI